MSVRRRVFLADFGLGRALDAQTHLTRSGALLGTPAYMSPEQARGEAALRPASDVWALGCVLFECLAGRRAFDGETPAAVLGAVFAGRIPPLGPGIPPAVRRLLRAALAPRPAARPRDAGAFRADCDRVARGEAPRARPPRRIRAGVVLAGIAALVAAVAAAWPWTRPPPVDDASAWAERAWAARATDPRASAALMARAVAAAPARHDWRLQWGLLAWAGRDDATAHAAWAGVPAGAPERTRAAWLTGLAHCAAHFEDWDAPHRRAAEAAWREAAGGDGPEAGWAEAGLASIRGDDHGVRARLGEPADWEPALLAGLCETLADRGGRPFDAARAARAYDRVIAAAPQFTWVRNHRGLAHSDLAEWEAAIADFDACLARDPTHWNARVNRALARAHRGDLAGAEADYDAVLAANPTHGPARLNRAALRRKLGRRDESLADLEVLAAAHPDDARVRFARGNAYREAGRLSESLAEYDAALAVAPAHRESRINRGITRRTVGDLDGALADLDLAVAAHPEDPEARQGRADVRWVRGDHAGALADLDALLRAVPEEVEAIVRRAWYRSESGDPRGAAADLATALTIEPGHGWAHIQRAGLRQAAGDNEGAEADYDAGLVAIPDDLGALVNRGVLRRARGDLAGARADFERALAVQPDLPEALANRAVVRLDQGDPGGAVADLERALAAAPPDWQYRQQYAGTLALAQAAVARAR